MEKVSKLSQWFRYSLHIFQKERFKNSWHKSYITVHEKRKEYKYKVWRKNGLRLDCDAPAARKEF